MNQVVVLGPNIARSNESFHVHAVGCSDVKKSHYARVSSYVYENSTLVEIVEDTYADQIAESVGNGENFDDIVNGWSGDFKVFPCAEAVFSVKVAN